MIQIIAGTFGYYNGRKVVPITNADGPIQLDEALEKRLVDKKVAVYVTEKPAEPKKEAEQPPEGSELPAYDISMKLKELQEIAEAYGVDASGIRAKAEVIAAIEAAQADDEDPEEETDDEDQEDPESVDGDDELPPALGAADPV